MHPILFRIPLPEWTLPGIGKLPAALPIYSYGVMLGLSLIVGWYLTLHLAEKDGLPKETMANCYVATAVAALVGARLLYVVTNLSEFSTMADVFNIRRGGLVAYGGFLGGFLGSWGYLKRKKIPLMPWADVAVPSLASGLMITRLGCYLFGCDFGKPLTASAPAWLQKLGTFPHWADGTVEHGAGAPAWIHHVNKGLISPDAAASLPVHPTQIYESLIGVVLLALVFLQRRHQRFRGQVFMTFAFAYGAARFLLEIVRDDAERGAYGPEMGQHLWVAGALALFAIGYVVAFAQNIRAVSLRRLTQVLAFVPAVVAYLAMRPGAFQGPQLVQLSTSQWVGVLTALAVAAAHVLYAKAAETHPDVAMRIDLSGFYELEKAQEAKASGAKTPSGGGRVADVASDDDDEEQVKKPAPKDSEVLDATFDDDAAKSPAPADEPQPDKASSEPPKVPEEVVDGKATLASEAASQKPEGDAKAP